MADKDFAATKVDLVFISDRNEPTVHYFFEFILSGNVPEALKVCAAVLSRPCIELGSIDRDRHLTLLRMFAVMSALRRIGYNLCIHVFSSLEARSFQTGVSASSCPHCY